MISWKTLLNVPIEDDEARLRTNVRLLKRIPSRNSPDKCETIKIPDRDALPGGSMPRRARSKEIKKFGM
jgi:hypothetical protein